MNDLNPFEQELADRLHRQAQAVDISDTGVANVVQRGRQRTERLRVAVGLAAVVALSATVIGTIQVLSKPVSHRVAPATDSLPNGDVATPSVTIAGEPPSDELAPVTRIESNLVWNVVEPGTTQALGSIIWDNSSFANQKPPYLAWSSAPGKSNNQAFVPTLYRSDDGIHWTAAGGESFTQPEISMRGVGSRGGRMFAFGTAAATAPIPNGGGGEVVVDVSDDQGASWRNITLPVDLRGLAASKGIQSVGFQGDMVASDSGVVAVGVPIVNVDSSVYDGHNGGYIPRRDGAVLVDVPTCGQGVTESTVVFAGGFPRVVAPGVTSPVETTPANEGTTTNVGPPDTAPAETATANSCPVDSGPQQSDLIPWSDLGVDPTAVAAMFSPRVFVSTDGENFVEGAFPALPDGYQMNQIDVVATSNGYAASATLYAPMAGKGLAKLYTSPDGMTWTESDMPAGQYSYINVLNDGMVIAFGLDLTDSRPFAAVSADGALWTKVSLANLLEASDGATAQLNVWMSAAGPGGITAVAGIDVDPAAEAGGLSIEKDGVRLTMTESRYQAMVATDIATGDELGRFGGKSPTDSSGYLSYDQEGNYRVLNPDGTVRVVFDNTDMQGLFAQQDSVAPPKAVVLHSADGFNWSRDDIKPITGLSIYGTNRVQVTDSNVLVSMVDPNSRDAAGLPKTVVLVGTAKS